MTNIPDGFKPARFDGQYLKHVGPYYTKKTDDTVLVGLSVEEHHINYVDIAHGGILTTLADVALSFQVFLCERPAPVVTTVSLTTNFLGPVKLGDFLIADGYIDRLGKRLAYTHGSIRRGGDVVMTMNGVFNVQRRSAE